MKNSTKHSTSLDDSNKTGITTLFSLDQIKTENPKTGTIETFFDCIWYFDVNIQFPSYRHVCYHIFKVSNIAQYKTLILIEEIYEKIQKSCAEYNVKNWHKKSVKAIWIAKAIKRSNKKLHKNVAKHKNPKKFPA